MDFNCEQHSECYTHSLVWPAQLKSNNKEFVRMYNGQGALEGNKVFFRKIVSIRNKKIQVHCSLHAKKTTIQMALIKIGIWFYTYNEIISWMCSYEISQQKRVNKMIENVI